MGEKAGRVKSGRPAITKNRHRTRLTLRHSRVTPNLVGARLTKILPGCNMTSITNSWTSRYQQPPIEEMNRVGATNWKVFVDQANDMVPTLLTELRNHLGTTDTDAKVLDFGCGVGRIALRLHAEHGWPTHACDVNPAAVTYLESQLPDVSCAVTDYDPPLPYPDEFFDAVLSVSIWTHIPEDAQDRWLAEMSRILKPGGLALLTTSGRKALKARHDRGDKGWSDIDDVELARRGFVYVEYERFAKSPDEYPGITSSYGLTAHDPEYVRDHWSQFFTVSEIRPGIISRVQDLVICVKPN